MGVPGRPGFRVRHVRRHVGGIYPHLHRHVHPDADLRRRAGRDGRFVSVRAGIGSCWRRGRRSDFPHDHPIYRGDRVHAVGAGAFLGRRSGDGRSFDAQSGNGAWRIVAADRGVAVDDRRLLSALHDRDLHLCADRGHDFRRHPRRDRRRFGRRRYPDDDRHGGRGLPADDHDILLDADRHLSGACAARIG